MFSHPVASNGNARRTRNRITGIRFNPLSNQILRAAKMRAERFGKAVFGLDLCGATLRNRLSRLPRARLPTRSWLDGETGADWLAYC